MDGIAPPPGNAAIAVLGASGLIGEAITRHLMASGLTAIAVARRFTDAQAHAFAGHAVTTPIMDLDGDGLAALLATGPCDIVINCLGVLQDSSRGTTGDVHAGFVTRLVAAIGKQSRPMLLIHLSIPGNAADDATAFSRTKREAERHIAASQVPFVVLRPGFVIAPNAYGGSALIRALAALPVDLPQAESGRPFAVTGIGDITRTITHVVERWRGGARDWRETWDVMEERASRVGDVIAAMRDRLGGPLPWFALPSWLMTIGAKLADASAHLGWMPPIRSTALDEMRRGVSGDPRPWMAATGLAPEPLSHAILSAGAAISDKWFARLYLLKALMIAVLSVFWIVSGSIALFASFAAASAILVAHGFSQVLADNVTIASSLIDISVGCAIAVRRTCRTGLIAGIAVALGYMIGAAVVTPDIWIEPLGAVVKTGPAIVLMLVALAILDDR